MKPLRIALIYPGYPPEESLGGGISTYAQEAAEGLERQGIHVTVLSRTESFQEKIEKKKKIRIFRIPGETERNSNNPSLSFRKKGAFLHSQRVRDLIRKLENQEGPFDIIEAGDWGGEAIALLPEYQHKLLIRCHTPSFISESYNPLNPSYLSKYVKSLEKRVLKQALYIASPSRSLIEKIKKHISLTANITIQPYSLTIKNIPYKRIYPTKFNKLQLLRIIMCGRLEQRKGQDIACRALQNLWKEGYNVEITFVGSDTPLKIGGSFRTYLLRIVNPRFHKHIKFLGHIPRTQLVNIYPQYDVYLSASRFESLGFVVLEAMRGGLLLIASNICEMPRLIQHGQTGYLFENENINQLASLVKNLFINPQKIRQMGELARRKIIDEYDGDKSIHRMIDLYQLIIKKYGRKNNFC